MKLPIVSITQRLATSSKMLNEKTAFWRFLTIAMRERESMINTDLMIEPITCD